MSELSNLHDLFVPIAAERAMAMKVDADVQTNISTELKFKFQMMLQQILGREKLHLLNKCTFHWERNNAVMRDDLVVHIEIPTYVEDRGWQNKIELRSPMPDDYALLVRRVGNPRDPVIARWLLETAREIAAMLLMIDPVIAKKANGSSIPGSTTVRAST